MKSLIFVSTFLLIFISCRTNDKKSANKTETGNYIDKKLISKIELLIADTSIIDLPSKQLTRLVEIGDAESFVDSSGTPLYPPSQKIIFENINKDNLVDIFNDCLNISQRRPEPTTCINLYRHVFLLYDGNGKINEQINLSFDCLMSIDYLHRGTVRPLNDRIILFDRLLTILKSARAYIPEYGPPPPLKN